MIGAALYPDRKEPHRRGDILVYRWDGHHWSTPFVLPPSGRFLPVAADFGPDGRFYVLERAVSFFGFRSRLRRWVIADDVPKSEETLFETGTGTHDNLEGPFGLARQCRGGCAPR